MSFQSLLRQTVSIENPGTARDKNGRAVLGSSTSYKARVQRTNKTIITAERDREPIDAIIFLDRNAVVSKGAKLTYDSEAYRVMTIEDVPGRNGTTHHYEIKAQLWSYNS